MWTIAAWHCGESGEFLTRKPDYRDDAGDTLRQDMERADDSRSIRGPWAIEVESRQG